MIPDLLDKAVRTNSQRKGRGSLFPLRGSGSGVPAIKHELWFVPVRADRGGSYLEFLGPPLLQGAKERLDEAGLIHDSVRSPCGSICPREIARSSNNGVCVLEVRLEISRDCPAVPEDLGP